MSEESGSILFSSLRAGSGSLLSQSSLAMGARSSRSLASSVGYTLNTTALTSLSQSSYTLRPNRSELSAPMGYSYAAAAQRVNRRHRHRGGASGTTTSLIGTGVPDAGSSLLLFVIAVGGFAALRLLPAVTKSVARA
jgi:hypothetical protein